MAQKLLNLYFFTVDLKSGLILEMNPGEQSGLRALNKGGKNFYADTYFPYLKKLVGDEASFFHYSKSDNPLHDLEALKHQNIEGQKIVAFGFVPNYNPEEVTAFASANPDFTIVNANASAQAIYRNKNGLQAVGKARNAQCFPKTYKLVTKPNYSMREIEEIENNISQHFKDTDFIVIKPAEAWQGEGIIITPKTDLESTLLSILTGKINSNLQSAWARSAKFWSRPNTTAVQFQEYVPDIRGINGKRWDVTPRLVCAVTTTEDPAGQINAHAKVLSGFLQMPRAPQNADLRPTYETAISCAYPNGLLDAAQMVFSYGLNAARPRMMVDQQTLQSIANPVISDIENMFSLIENGSDPVLARLGPQQPRFPAGSPELKVPELV